MKMENGALFLPLDHSVGNPIRTHYWNNLGIDKVAYLESEQIVIVIIVLPQEHIISLNPQVP